LYPEGFGRAQQDVQNLWYFMIGAAALGCEPQKNWVMMEVATKGPGRIWLPDLDQIERLNLSCQFLFRNLDIGKMKAVAAVQAAVMTPRIWIEPQSNKTGKEMAQIYNDAFFGKLIDVCNGLGNIAGLVFSDQQCVHYGRPLLERGTLGANIRMQIVIPNTTESYGSQVDPQTQAS
jgi:ubiquitin-activating enzyme E1